MQQLKGQSRAPDVVDVGTPFAVEGATDHLWAPYKVQTWSNIPANAKDANGDWYADYGGYVAIGYNPAKVKVAPTSFASLTNPAYKNMIGLNNSPTTAGAAFAAVYAAALANGGSFSNIEPGIKYFAHLKAIGNFVPDRHRRPDHRAERHHADPDLVGLPAGLRGDAGRSRASRS